MYFPWHYRTYILIDLHIFLKGSFSLFTLLIQHYFRIFTPLRRITNLNKTSVKVCSIWCLLALTNNVYLRTISKISYFFAVHCRFAQNLPDFLQAEVQKNLRILVPGNSFLQPKLLRTLTLCPFSSPRCTTFHREWKVTFGSLNGVYLE